MHFAPRHSLRIVAVFEDFSGASPTTVERAVDWVTIPRRARLERNDIHTADRLSVEVDFRSFPFHPSMIRTASVAYSAWDEMSTPFHVGAQEHLRFLGTLDVPELSMGDESFATLECRDYTAILLGQKATRDLARRWNVPLGRPLDDILSDLLATLPGEQSQLFHLQFFGGGRDWPTVPAGGRTNARLAIEPKDTLWSVIQRLVDSVGHVCWVDMSNLVVSTSRNLTARARPARFSFGRNLSALRLRRDPQNETRPVALVQFDPRTGQRTQAVFPPDAGQRRRGGGRGRAHAAITASGQGQTGRTEGTPESFTVTSSLSAAGLALAAENAYRMRARTEMEGSLTTYEMRLGDYDLLTAKTNDPIEAVIEEQVRAIVSESGGDATLSVVNLMAAGYPPTVARALVEAWRSLDQVRTPYVVRKATLEIGESGFQADLDFQNALTPYVGHEIPPEAQTSTRSRA